MWSSQELRSFHNVFVEVLCRKYQESKQSFVGETTGTREVPEPQSQTRRTLVKQERRTKKSREKAASIEQKKLLYYPLSWVSSHFYHFYQSRRQRGQLTFNSLSILGPGRAVDRLFASDRAASYVGISARQQKVWYRDTYTDDRSGSASSSSVLL